MNIPHWIPWKREEFSCTFPALRRAPYNAATSVPTVRYQLQQLHTYGKKTTFAYEMTRIGKRFVMFNKYGRNFNLLTPWCRALLEKLTGLQLVKKLPAFHGTRRFITALTSVRHLSPSWASLIQSIYPHPTPCRSILILPTHLRLVSPVVHFLPVSPPTPYTPHFPHPYAPHAQPISFFSILSPAQYWMRSTNHLASRYAISVIPPLPRPS